jgi:hypothetical protein
VLARGGPYLLHYGQGRDASPMETLAPVPLRPLHRLPLQLIRNMRDRLGIPHAWLLASPRRDLAQEAVA